MRALRHEVDNLRAGAADRDFCGTVVIESEADLAMVASFTHRCMSISRLSISGGGSNTTLLAFAFANLRIVGETLDIVNNTDVRSLVGVFPQLEVSISNPIPTVLSALPPLLLLFYPFPSMHMCYNEAERCGRPQPVKLALNTRSVLMACKLIARAHILNPTVTAGWRIDH